MTRSLTPGGSGSPDGNGTSDDSGLAGQWAQIRARLRADFGDAAFNSWLKPLTFSELVGSRVRIAVPTRFMRDWIEAHYAGRIQDLWCEENPAVKSVEVIVAPARPVAPVSGGAPRAAGQTGPGGAERPGAAGGMRGGIPGGIPGRAPGEIPAGVAAPNGAPAPDGEARGGGYGGHLAEEMNMGTVDPRFTFDNFVVGRPNELAHAAARRVAESDEVPFNPLFLYGGVGLGKTHLMHAIAWHIRTRAPRRRVLYMSAETFMYQFIRALRYKTTMTFKEQFRSVDVLMIDDIQFIAGKDSTQEEFFHTFNALVDQNRQIVISADKSPADIEAMEERLRSRLGWGLVADIHPTDYELRLGILQSKAEQLGAECSPKVLEFLAHRITSNVRELEGALNRLVAHANLVGRKITLDSTQEVLHDLLRANDRRVTIEEIQKRVAEHYNIRLADMHSARRARAVARPRQVAMYLAKQLTTRSLPEIGRKFGGRDHTTVMHAVRKIDELRATDNSFSEDIELLRRMLET